MTVAYHLAAFTGLPVLAEPMAAGTFALSSSPVLSNSYHTRHLMNGRVGGWVQGREAPAGSGSAVRPTLPAPCGTYSTLFVIIMGSVCLAQVPWRNRWPPWEPCDV